MRIIVTGGRDYKDFNKVYYILNSLHPSVIGVGDCPTGVDYFVRSWVVNQELPPEIKVYKADWDTHGRAAGPIRNKAMIDGENPWFCLAFPGGRGTENCVKQCKEAGIPVLRVEE